MNVALVRLSSLGDVVHALPAAAALRAGLPGARLTWIAEAREAALLRDNPVVDEVVAVDTRRWRRARRPVALAEAAGALAGLRERLRRAALDVVVDLQGTLKSGLLTAATRAPLRIGFAARHCREPLAALFTNRRVAPPARAQHVVDQNLALLQPLGVAGGPPIFSLPRDSRAEARADAILAEAGLKARDRLVMVTPGAGRPDKRWPAERFGALARHLAERGAAVLVLWGPAEQGAARTVARAAAPARVVLAPPTDVGELTALLRRASVVVGADTGPLHLAAALGTVTVGLYGPTRAARNGPYGQVQRALESPDGRLASLGVARVLAAVTAALEGQ